MLTPINRPIDEREIITYDLEWIPGSNPKKAREYGFEPLQLRMVGVYDGARYRYYESIEAFLSNELTIENSGRWFYAHAGGLADMKFVIEYLIDNPQSNLNVEIAFSGSSAIIVKLTRSRCKWYFLDSLWLIRSSLKKIGKWMGYDKLGEDEGVDMFYAPMAQLVEYNERDCMLLYKAIRRFERTVNELGGSLEMTVASTAIKLMRRSFLKENIRPMRTTNKAGARSYIASRVEVFSRRCGHADYYDINSSFPHAMTYPAPGNLKETMRGAVPSHNLFIAEATIEVPPCDVPPLPYRHDDGRIYFPVGKWEGWFTGVDLQFLEETGGRIHSIGRVLVFHPWNDLKNYCETIYELRRTSKDDAERQILKILLNSLYGKLGEGTTKRSALINPPRSFFYYKDGRRKFDPLNPRETDPKEIMPGVYDRLIEKTPPHRHVPAAAHITAIARRSLSRHLLAASKVYYCDTDGFACPLGEQFDTGDQLGALKHEKKIVEGHFVSPKLYAMREEGKDWSIKAKGFSKVVEDPQKAPEKLRQINYEDFCGLIEGRGIPLNQFVRIKSGLAKQDYAPRENIVYKRLTFRIRPKRCFDSDGGSRPWSIEEIKNDD